MKSEEAKKKKKYHQNRVKFYIKKLEEAEKAEKKIGFKFNKE